MIRMHLSGSAPCMKLYLRCVVTLGAALTVLSLYVSVCRENEGDVVFPLSPLAAVTLPTVKLRWSRGKGDTIHSPLL